MVDAAGRVVATVFAAITGGTGSSAAASRCPTRWCARSWGRQVSAAPGGQHAGAARADTAPSRLRHASETTPGRAVVCTPPARRSLPPGARGRHAPRRPRPFESPPPAPMPRGAGVVMCEVSLSRVEELLLGIARESRPALAVGDPAVPFVIVVMWPLSLRLRLHLDAPRRGRRMECPGFHGRKMLRGALSIRFQNVADRQDSVSERTRIQLCGRLSVEIDGVAAGRRAARPAGAAAARLPGAQPRSPRRARGADRGAVARPRAASRRTRRCGRCSRACARRSGAVGARRPRRADPRAARAGLDRRRGGRSTRSSARSRRWSAATRAAPGRWPRSRSTSPAAGCCPARRRAGSSRAAASSRTCGSRRSR